MTAASAESLLWIALGALFVPMISRRMHLPSAVGELIYGMVFGQYLLGIIETDQIIDFMGQLGFAILMFSAGMEIDFAPLRKKGSKLLGVSIQWALLTFAAVLAGHWFLKLDRWSVLAVCSVSIGLASVLLKERKLSGTPIGQVILAAGLIGESASIFMLAIFDFHAEMGLTLEFYESLLKFMGLFVLAYVVMRIFRFVIWWMPKKIAPFLKGEDPLELGVRLAVAMMFIFLAAAVLLGVEAILGAFIAGALFGFIFQEREVIEDKISAMGQGFFVPFFFIVVGSHFNPLGSLYAFSGLLFLKLFALALVVKLIPTIIFLRTGLKFKETLAAGLMLAAPLTLTVAVAEVGVRLEVITHEMQGMLLLVAIAAGVGCPFLARLLLSEEEVEEETGNAA